MGPDSSVQGPVTYSRMSVGIVCFEETKEQPDYVRSGVYLTGSRKIFDLFVIQILIWCLPVYRDGQESMDIMTVS